MPWFKCFIAGYNFPGILAGQSQPVGFYTTRFVEAFSPDAAEAEVLKALQEDKCLILPENFVPTVNAQAFVEEIVEIPASEISSHPEGLVWYAMEKKDK